MWPGNSKEAGARWGGDEEERHETIRDLGQQRKRMAVAMVEDDSQSHAMINDNGSGWIELPQVNHCIASH